MPGEELRIVVVDQGGSAPSRGPTVPGGGQGPGGGRGPVAPPVQPPPFLKPPPVQPTPRTPKAKDPFAPSIAVAGTIGGIAGQAAAGNVAGAAAGATASLVAVGGPIGLAAAAIAGGFGVAAIAALKFANVVESQVGKLAGFSGPLSAAQAQTDISREQALFRRANRIGPELAAAERLRSKFEDQMTDLGTEVLGVLLKLLDSFEPFIEIGIKVLDVFGDFLDKHGETIAKAMFILIQLHPLVTITEAILLIAQKLLPEGVEDDPLVDEFTTQFMNLLPRNARGERVFFQPRTGV